MTNETVGIRLRGDNVELEFDGFMVLLRKLNEYRRIVDAARALDESLTKLGVCQETWKAQAVLQRALNPEPSDALTALQVTP
jgi:hypothetical protein